MVIPLKWQCLCFFENMNFDSVTITPYMGLDSVSPFLEFKNKWVILLALTSNKSSSDFQKLEGINGEKLFEKVIEISKHWGFGNKYDVCDRTTQSKQLSEVRKIIPNHFLLVPGVGIQGGNLKDVAKYGMNKDCGILVNSSREVIYSDDGVYFGKI